MIAIAAIVAIRYRVLFELALERLFCCLLILLFLDLDDLDSLSGNLW